MNTICLTDLLLHMTTFVSDMLDSVSPGLKSAHDDGKSTVDYAAFKSVYSHPQALHTCAQYLMFANKLTSDGTHHQKPSSSSSSYLGSVGEPFAEI